MIISPSGRIYIGSTKDINYRWDRYNKLLCKSQTKLYNSFIKYGVENHTFEIIWEGNINDRLKYERLCGDYYEVLDIKKGLNLRLPGYDEVPSTVSEETRLKLSNLAKGRKAYNKGISPTKEIKLKMSISAKNKKIKSSLNSLARENSRKKSIKAVICTKTGKEFESIKLASESYNITAAYLRDQLRGKWKNKTTLIYKNG